MSKTSIAGIGMILAAVGPEISLWFDGNPATMPNWGTIVGGVCGGLGLIFASDHKKEPDEKNPPTP